MTDSLELRFATQQFSRYLRVIVENPLYESRLHGRQQGGEVLFHENHILAGDDPHRRELGSGMTVADLNELAQWLGSEGGDRWT